MITLRGRLRQSDRRAHTARGHLLFPSDRIVPDQLGVVHLHVTKREKPMAFKE